MNNTDYEQILNMIESGRLRKKVEEGIRKKFSGKRLVAHQVCGYDCVTPLDVKAEVNRILMEEVSESNSP